MRNNICHHTLKFIEIMKQLTIYTTPDSQLGKKVIAHAHATGSTVQIVDFTKTPLTETQVRKCLVDCNVKGEELISKESYSNTEFPISNASDEDWITILVSNPHLLQYPIVKCDGIYKLLKSPAEVSLI